MPVYKYAKPTEKAQFGKPADLGYDINAYKLPVCDTQTERRNFPGYTESQVFSMEDILKGDSSGTTDTDATAPEDKYEGRRGSGYTRINQKKGKVRND